MNNPTANRSFPGAAAGLPPLLQVQNATVVKNGRPVLDGISLTIQEGEHTAILGPNGSGKSSLIRLITYLDYPLAHPDDTPPVLIFGKSLWNVFELRSMVGIISPDIQFSFLKNGITGRTRGREVVLSGFFASYGVFRHHQVTEAMRTRVRQALELMEASHLANIAIEAMSTGEVRRILIARALVPDPRALILDEPTTGLDLMARHRFLGTLQNLARLGKTIILVTHHVEEILPEVTRVILLQEGRLLADGPKAEVLTSANLSSLYQASIEVRPTGGFYTAVSQAAPVVG